MQEELKILQAGFRFFMDMKRHPEQEFFTESKRYHLIWDFYANSAFCELYRTPSCLYCPVSDPNGCRHAHKEVGGPYYYENYDISQRKKAYYGVAKAYLKRIIKLRTDEERK